MNRGWIGVDLDGTLAQYDGWVGIEHIGEPIPEMVERVKLWLDEGYDVRIFTARVAETNPIRLRKVTMAIREWCYKHIGQELPVTNCKDYGMIDLYDDRCHRVEKNTGRLL